MEKQQETMSYQIAGILLQVLVPVEIDPSVFLPSFADFRTTGHMDLPGKIKVELVLSATSIEQEERKLLSDVSDVWGDRFRFEESVSWYITTVQSEQATRQWTMYSTKDFKHSWIHVVEEELYTSTVLSWLLMVAYGQAITAYDAVLIHASVVEKEGRGYAFLGKSGTGKSTHSRLWLHHIEGTSLLNDDNPVVRVLAEGDVFVYGTPWSGKTPCYRNRGVALRGIIRLHQASRNHLAWKEGKEAFIALLPSGSSIRWNRALFALMANTLENILRRVPVGVLDCLPNREAALLCHNELMKKC